MAEGSVEEDNGDMLGPTAPSIIQTPAPSNNGDIKEEESDCDSSVSSPEPASAMGIDATNMGPKSFYHRSDELTPNETKLSPNSSPHNHPHINGTMAGLATFQNLQNLVSLQQSLPQVASLAAGLQNMASLANNAASNAPLNLSVSASAATPRSTQSSTNIDNVPSMLPGGINHHPSSVNGLSTAANPLLNSQQPAPMPQFILASGQLVQGIQGAQLLIPTSQGLATQTILTIPVNHVNSTDQMVNLALNNGQVVTTSLANLQAMAHSNLLSNSQTQGTNGTLGANMLGSNPLSHLLANGTTQSMSQLLQNIPQMLAAAHPQAQGLSPLNQPPFMPTQQNLHAPSPQPSQHRSSHISSSLNHYSESKIHQQPMPKSSSPPNTQIPTGRISTSNGELTITPSNSVQGTKRSPPREPSPGCNENSTSDLLIDSPNQPTINQTNSNVIDGINLDEIKDFAKAFKLRRLSLGLTQTQVGQALSVTEGPAYSQSAICSALASQMFAAAQLSSQQQMFEKLDITPKSAQKIKPVLERWMKEAEDRYKSGQNHLTDFIGIEPSKKRKRRTSFTPQALELLNAHFERNTHPSGTEITGLAHQLGYEREVIRIWFCNKRQALKNTVRMMSKGMV